MKVVHYINQFFAGIGGEEQASIGLDVRDGAVGPGRLLSQLLEKDGISVEVSTVFCGDTYAAENVQEVAAFVADTVRNQRADVFVAGPAFFAGRYGLISGELAVRIPAMTGVPAITGFFEENPALGLFRSKALIVKTGASAASMADAMKRIAQLVPRLARGETDFDHEAEGLFGAGVRKNKIDDRTAAMRAVDALQVLLAGQEFGTELAIPDFDAVRPPAPIHDLSEATVALVTEGGLVPRGNPDNLSTGSSERWGRYPVKDLLERVELFHSIHGGYDTKYVNESPYRLVPADVLAALAAEGKIGKLHPFYYVTSGTATKVENCRMMGAQIAEVLRNDGVDAVIFTST